MCHHFHLSLQSGCNDTLKRMNRRYTTEEFEEIVNRIRNIYDDSILTTDIIVGFPGETEEEFLKTYDFLKKIKFYKMHVFKYSIRKGTKAAEMKNQITPEKKEERSNKLIELSEKNEKEYLEQYLEKNIDVLFEENEGNYCKGHTANYLSVKVKKSNSEDNQCGKILPVKIKSVDKLELIGDLIY